MNDIIVSTWGIGPIYRKRVISNITKAINTGYDNILPYIILTDKPDDFYEFQDKTKKIIDVIDIHKAREKDKGWSVEYECIPETFDEKEYSVIYRENALKYHKQFSYALHRYTIPRIAELGYNKFLFCDCDTDILYNKIVNGIVTEEAFWEQYQTPVNTMKGCDHRVWKMSDDDWWMNNNMILGNILRFHLTQKFPEYQVNFQRGDFFLKKQHEETEGPFRFYHLKDIEMVKKYFELWNEATRIVQTTPEFRRHLTTGGGYITIDNTPVSSVNDVMGIKPLNFDKFWHKVNIYRFDRCFFPKGHVFNVGGKSLSLQPANTIEEFNEINKELIEHLRLHNDYDE